ncbi:MAG: 3-deoxy-D-manno-octulosonic acid transferase [Bacteroidaceae bacterium]|nr:3-deoxy-D-manno-octulosonic acid transferase [Bacteroidaceae bacterium]
MYNLAIYLYLLAVKFVGLFSKKVKLMRKGHKEVFDILRTQIDKDSQYLWFHAASLGEFEQGRPLIERIRKAHPHYKILLTLFSPSGYEVRKNYEGADVICYLPFDTPRNVRRFLDLARPSMAFFIKYEFWQNYMKGLQKRHIPTYSVSSIFRPNQVFFRWFGGRYYKVLTRITHFFVQNEESVRLLATRGITNVTVVGDTRFDRVLEINQAAKQLPLVERFKGECTRVLVAGSSWQPDEELFIEYFNRHPEMKLIIAPHVVNDSHLAWIESKLNRPSIRYTRALGTGADLSRVDCLIIDCYGLLSSIYRYGEVSYVGGGFGVGIHNVLEAAVYGIPVLFGPNNQRFREARQLLSEGGAFEIHDITDFNATMDRLFTDEAFLCQSGECAGHYVNDNAGAADAVLAAIKL